MGTVNLQWFPFKPFTDQIDEVIGEIRNISEGEVLDLSPFTVAMSQQVVLVASAILDTLHDRDVYGSFLCAHGRDVMSTATQSATPTMGCRLATVMGVLRPIKHRSDRAQKKSRCGDKRA